MTIAVKDRRLLLLYPPSWALPGAAIDNFFSQNLYFGASLANYTITRAQTVNSYASTLDGLQVPYAANMPRITNKGWLIEDSRTNVVLWSRDLTNAAWTATSVTVAKNQVGADGVANSASSLTATGANGTVLQTTTVASSARFQSAFVKRLTGTGTINMTMDNGVTWTAITVTSSYTQLTIPTQTLANPIVGFRIVTSGDAIAVDFVQNENSAINASSPIPTTTVAVTRNADAVTLALGSWFNSAQGWWYANALFTPSTTSLAMLLEGGSAAVKGMTMGTDGTTFMRLLQRDGAVSAARGDTVTATPSLTTNNPVMSVVAWNAASTPFFSTNNTTQANSATPAQSNYDSTMNIGQRDGVVNVWNNYIRRIAYGSNAISQAEANVLSSQ